MPASQSMHSPCSEKNWPVLQPTRQDDAPATEVEGKQLAHALEPIVPANIPAVQFTQLVEPKVDEYMPTAHLVHSDCPASE